MVKKNYELDFVFDKAIEQLEKLNESFTKHSRSAAGHAKRNATLAASMADVASSFGDQEKFAQKVIDKLLELAAVSPTYSRQLKDLKDASEALSGSYKTQKDALAALTAKIEEAKAARSAEESDKEKKKIAEVTAEIISQTEALESLYAEKQRQLRENELASLRGDKAVPYPTARFADDPEKAAAFLEGQSRLAQDRIADRQQQHIQELENQQKQATERAAKHYEEWWSNALKERESLEKDIQQALEDNQRANREIDNIGARNLEVFEESEAAAQKSAEAQYAAYEKNAQKQIEQEEKDKRTRRELIESENARIAKIEADYIAKSKAKEEKAEKEKTQDLQEEIDKRFKLIKQYLDFQADIASGKIRKGPTGSINTSAAQLTNVAKGEEELNNLRSSKGGLTPEVFTGLSNAVGEYERSLELASAAQAKYSAIAKDSNNKVQEFTLSWQTMGRIIAARAVTQVFFEFQNLIRQSVVDARELFIAVAEIETITNEAYRTTANYGESLQRVLDLSSQINFSPIDTANAVYEALSNQLGENTAQLINFIQVAGNLGKVTRASLAESADAIASVVNAYNLSVSDSLDISKKFFTLVDEGRLKLEEVANHMGNVAVPAAQLGVSFDEVVAALSAISIAGIPAREAMTLQRNVMFKLIDPTEKMQELFKKWGVTSGQAAIATFGFTGTLEKLNIEAAKGNEEVEALFGTIRAVRGILGLTDENFQKYLKALDSIKKSHEQYSKIVEDYLKNPGEQFNRFLLQTKNEVLQVGLRIVELASYIANLAGSTNDGVFYLAILIGYLTKLGIVLGATVTSFVLLTAATHVYSAATGRAAVAATGLTAAQTSLATANTAAAASGLAATGFIGNFLKALSNVHPIVKAGALIIGLGATMAAFSKSSATKLAEISAQAAEANKDISKSFYDGMIGSLKKVAEEYDSRTRQTLQKLTENIQVLDDEINKLSKNTTVKSLIDDFERLSNAVSGDEAAQRLAFALGDVDKYAGNLGVTFNKTTSALEKQNDAFNKQGTQIQGVIDKLLALRDASQDAIKDSRLATAQSITERNLSLLSTPDRARAEFGVAQNIAQQAGQTGNIEEARELYGIARKFLADAERSAFESGAFGTLEKHVQFFNQQEAALAAAQENRERQEIAGINRQGEQLQGQKDQLEAQYEKNAAELENRRIAQERINLEKSFLEYYDKKSKEIANNESLSQQEKINKQRELYDLVRPELETGAAQKALDNSQNIAEIQIERDAQAAAVDEIVRQKDLEAQASQALVTSLTDLQTKTAEVSKSFDAALKQVEQNIGPKIPIGFGLSIPVPTPERQELEALKKEVEENKKLAETDPQLFAQKLQEFTKELAAIAQKGIHPAETIEALRSTVQQLQGIPLVQQSLIEQQKAYYESLTKSTDTQNTALQTATTAMENLNVTLTNLPAAVNQILSNVAPLTGKGYARGGPVGTDTVPAWLTPGEFVVNRRAAQQNLSWLKMINSGRSRGYANGGVVSNTTQSFNNNINITSSNPNMQANQLVGVIKRQLSQGKATLSKGRPY